MTCGVTYVTLAPGTLNAAAAGRERVHTPERFRARQDHRVGFSRCKKSGSPPLGTYRRSNREPRRQRGGKEPAIRDVEWRNTTFNRDLRDCCGRMFALTPVEMIAWSNAVMQCVHYIAVVHSTALVG